VNYLQSKAFIIGENYTDALVKALTDKVTIQVAEAEDSGESIISPSSHTSSTMEVESNGILLGALAGAVGTIIGLAGFGYYKWNGRRQLNEKKGKKHAMLSDHVPMNMDEGALYVQTGQTVCDGITDGIEKGTETDLTTPATLASAKSFQSTGSGFEDYSLDGSYAVGQSPNRGERFSEGVINMGDRSVDPNAKEAPRANSADNDGSASVFSFPNQYNDSESVAGGLSVASTCFTGNGRSKYVLHKALSSRTNSTGVSGVRGPASPHDASDEKCEDSIEIEYTA